MATDTKLIIGGVVIAGIGLYMFRDKIKGLFSGLQTTSDAVGETSSAVSGVVSTTGDALESWIDLLNLKKDAAALSNLAGSFLSQQNKIQDLSNKNAALMQDIANRKASTITYIPPTTKTSNVSIANPKNTMGLPTTIKSTTTGQTIQNPFSFENLSNVSLTSGKTGIAGRTGIISYI